MLSVLEQKYPALSYVVMDGGSTDESPAIIARYADRLAAWSSAPDRGQYPAVAAGFDRTSGEVMGWLNSDDMYCPWALSVVGEIFGRFPEIEWLTTARPLFWDREGRAVHGAAVPGYARRAFSSGEHLPRGTGSKLGYIQQESTFWRRTLWERAGGFDSAYPLAGDFALWARFFREAELYAVETPLGGFRSHGDQKTGRAFASYAEEAEQALTAYGGRRPGRPWRILREAALRSPAVSWPAWARAGYLHRAKVVRYERRAEAWRIEERYV